MFKKNEHDDIDQLEFLLKIETQNLLNCELELINENDVKQYYFRNIVDRCIDLNDISTIEKLYENKIGNIHFNFLNRQSLEYIRSMRLLEKIKTKQANASTQMKAEEGMDKHYAKGSALFTNRKQTLTETNKKILTPEETINFIASNLKNLDENSMRTVFSQISPNAFDKVCHVVESLKKVFSHTAIPAK